MKGWRGGGWRSGAQEERHAGGTDASVGVPKQWRWTLDRKNKEPDELGRKEEDGGLGVGGEGHLQQGTQETLCSFLLYKYKYLDKYKSK